MLLLHLSGPELVQIQASLVSERLKRLSLEGLDGLGGQPKPDVGVTLGPPDTLPLQVNILDLVVPDVRERDGHAIVGPLSEEHALFAARLLVGLGGPSSGAGHLDKTTYQNLSRTGLMEQSPPLPANKIIRAFLHT